MDRRKFRKGDLMSKTDRFELLISVFNQYCNGLINNRPANEVRSELLKEHELTNEETEVLNSLFMNILEFRFNQSF